MWFSTTSTTTAYKVGKKPTWDAKEVMISGNMGTQENGKSEIYQINEEWKFKKKTLKEKRVAATNSCKYTRLY